MQQSWPSTANITCSCQKIFLGLGYLIVEQLTKNENTKSTYNYLSIDCGFQQTILFATTVLHNHYQFTNTRSVESHQDTIEVTKTLSSH